MSEESRPTINVWTFIKALSETKELIFNEHDISITDAYVPFIINKALCFLDTLETIEVLNRYPWLDKKIQHDLLYYGLKTKKRWKKWVKIEKNEELENVMQYFKYSRKKAEEIFDLLSPDMLQYINSFYESAKKEKLEKENNG